MISRRSDAHEVAEMLCLKYRTVTRYIQAGQIRARKIGKKYFVTEQDVKLSSSPRKPTLKQSKPKKTTLTAAQFEKINDKVILLA